MSVDQIRWSIVLPYFNEADYLPATLASLGRQTMTRFRLILVDNGSTDASEEIARTVMQGFPKIATTFIREERPGKIPALVTGLAAVDTAFVATCDADTYYPSAISNTVTGCSHRTATGA